MRGRQDGNATGGPTPHVYGSRPQMSLNAADFARRIKGAKQSAGEWSGRCPAHADDKPSLTWADGEKGLVITCHKGCTFERILRALDLDVISLFSEEGARPPIVATYPYSDDQGNPHYEVVRYADKTFKHRRTDDRGGYIWNVQGSRRLLYCLPKLRGQKVMVVVEGEKDADTLWALGIPATTNSGGAGKWTDDHTAQLGAAGVHQIVILPDNDEPGKRHGQLVARSCRAGGLAVKIVQLPDLPVGGDVSAWMEAGHTKEDLVDVLGSPPEVADLDGGDREPARGHIQGETGQGDPRSPNPWEAARPVSALLSQEDEETAWLDEPLVAPGAVTEMFSPRGIGKTHVAYAKGIALAKAGKRVLLVDRDNPPREVKRRLRAWGAASAPLFKVLTRGEAPPLTDAKAWAQFPAAEYDLVIIDSLDATAEGIGEKDSAKPSRALKPILDLAHGAHGPAFLILGNTVRSGVHSRGSGVIEDRADICYEVRDATNFQPTADKEWWRQLPSADAAAWGDRASRRKGRETLRLAFIVSKFRLGEEPDPFVLEIDMTTEPWSLQDVTSEIVEGGKVAQAQAAEESRARLDRAAHALDHEIHRREQANEEPMLKDRDAEPFLTKLGLKRKEARTLIQSGGSGLWRLEKMSSRHGQPVVLRSVLEPNNTSGQCRSEDVVAGSIQSKTPRKQTTETSTLSADRINTERRKPGPRRPASDAAIRKPPLFAPSDSDSSEAVGPSVAHSGLPR